MLLREIIKETRASADSQASLHSLVDKQLPHLHTAIKLPKNDPKMALMDFLMRYVDHVPNFIDAIRGITKAAGIYDYTSVFLNLAENFFVEPPREMDDTDGLLALIGEAYLAHRLIEEVNDRVVARSGIPLTPMDMTRANLIVHELLGEEFANKLDFVVHYSTEAHMAKEGLMDNPVFHQFVDEHKKHGWQIEIDRWPCLAENLSINLDFKNDKTSKPVLH